jgi:hypothetical protein
LKTITAQAWRIGTVSVAFVLAVTLLFASSPSQVAQAAVGETTTCKIDITEKNGSTTVGAAAAGVVALVPASTAAMHVGQLLHVPSTGEDILVTAIVDGTNIKVLRAQNGTSAIAIAASAMVTFKTANTADSGPLTCMGSTSGPTTVTVTSATAGQKARVHVDHVTHSGVVTTTTAAEAIDATETVITLTATAAAAGIVADDVVAIGDEVMTVTSVSGNDLTVVRGAYGTTAVSQATGLTVYELTASFAKAEFADANPVMPKINGLSGRNQLSEAVDVNLDTFTAATATKAAFYSGTFEVSNTKGGEAVIAVRSANVGPVYGADPDQSENLVHVQFRDKPIDYTDANGNGAYNAGTDTLRTTITAQSAVVSLTTTANAVFEVADTKGQQLVGQAVLTIDDAGCAAGAVWTGSGTCTITHTTSATAAESVGIKKLPATGNFRYTWTGTFTGSSGTIDLGAITNKANSYVWRTNNVTTSLTAAIYYDATAGDTVGSTALTFIPAIAAGDADNYYIQVKALDSAGNNVADTIKVKDLDGDGTDGLGSDLTFEVYDGTAGGAAVTSITSASGKANFGIREAKLYTASATDPIAGLYELEFYRSADATVKVNITLPVKSAAKNFTIADSSGQNSDGSLSVGTVGTYLISATDINGYRISADLAAADVTFVVTGLGTGATAGKSVPSNGQIGIDDIKGGTVSIVAPTVAGSGTLAVIYGGKIVASKVIEFSSGAAGSATVSGTGCTGSSTGSYTCVVTEGGTAAEVATASGAVSVWQSDADGVLQGYVVGTPDFVDTGLASTAAIASNSAVIVVR